MTGLAALQSRDFRVYWLALMVSAMGTWMQIVAQSLLVLRLTHGNPAMLGVVALSQAAAFFLFALVGGSYADRFDRRRLLLVTQVVLMAIAFVLGVLVMMQAARVWMIVAAAFVSGVVLSFDQPARAALLPSLVPERDLLSAISLQATVFLGAAAVAPLFAGLAIEHFGLAGNFFLNSASFAAVMVALVAIPPRAAEARRATPLWESIRAGLQTVRQDALLRWVVGGYALLLFVAPSMQLLLPVLAERVLHLRPAWLGLLFAAYGGGAVGGSLVVGRLGFVSTRRLYLAALALWVVALAAVAMSRQMGFLLAALVVLGGTQNAIAVLTITCLQSRVAKQMRGRMMSLQSLLNMGLRPLGDFPIAMAIAGLGAPVAAGISAALVGCYGVYLLRTRDGLSGQPQKASPTL